MSNKLQKYEYNVLCKKYFLCNCTRNEHFAYLKQVAKSNFPPFAI
jgi:hypothetical protein